MLDTTINPFTKSDTSRLGFHLGEIVEELGGICQRFCQEYICYIHKLNSRIRKTSRSLMQAYTVHSIHLFKATFYYS